jgi:hypothetical protein
MEKFDIALNFLNKARDSGVSYGVASKVLPNVVAGKTVRKDRALCGTLQAREFGKMMRKGDFLEAHEFMEREDFFGRRVGYDVFGKWGIPESYMTEERRNKLILEDIKTGNTDPTERLNDVLKDFGHKEVVVGKDFVVSNLFKYELAEGVELKKNDSGKCILSYEDAGFYFAVSEKKSDVIPVDLGLENIARVMNNGFMSNKVGLHRNIPGNASRSLGGASYFMLEDDKIFVFDSSQDFGRISVPILYKCFQDSGVEVVDDFGKGSVSLEEEVLRCLGRKNKVQVEFDSDDDIPF